jgi:hypothetical protein
MPIRSSDSTKLEAFTDDDMDGTEGLLALVLEGPACRSSSSVPLPSGIWFMRRGGTLAVITGDVLCDELSERAFALVALRTDDGALTRLFAVGLDIGLCPDPGPVGIRGTGVAKTACADWLLPKAGIGIVGTPGAAEIGRGIISCDESRCGIGIAMRVSGGASADGDDC